MYGLKFVRFVCMNVVSGFCVCISHSPIKLGAFNCPLGLSVAIAIRSLVKIRRIWDRGREKIKENLACDVFSTKFQTIGACVHEHLCTRYESACTLMYHSIDIVSVDVDACSSVILV